MKRVLFLLIFISLMGCSKEEFEQSKNRYPLDLDSKLIIQVDVIPVGDVQMEFEDMSLEINADYYNRYGITVNIRLKEAISVPDQLIDNPERIWLPYSNSDRIQMYVVDSEYIRLPNASAYAVKNKSSRCIVLNQNVQTTRTPAHEIAHLHGLRHVDLPNNVMNPKYVALQHAKPNDFVEQQIDTIIQNMY